MRPPLYAWLGLLVCVALLPACRARSEPAHPAPGWYRAVVTSPAGVEVAFLVELPAPGGQARFRSGAYAFAADATVAAGAVRITMPVYGSTITATRTPHGLAGTVELFTPFGGKVALPLAGTPVPGPAPASLRDPAAPAAPPLELDAPVTHWRVDLDSGAVGKLTLTRAGPGAYDAVLLLDNGNATSVAGVGLGDRLRLSGFDGTAAYALDLTFAPDRASATAVWIAGQALDWREHARLRRGPDFDVATPFAPAGPLGLPALDRFAGKPVLVEIGASWCSTCSVVAPVLRAFYDQYHPRGLEVITLLYEFSDDPAYDALQAQRFQQTYGVPWPVVPVTGEPDEHLPTNIPAIDKLAFPLLFVLARDGTVRAARSGFPMDATDPAFTAAVAELRASIDAVVRE